MDFIEETEIYRLGALCGIYSKQELIKYLDKLIYDLEDVPCEIIEASLLHNKNINEISDKLIELTWRINVDRDSVTKQLLHIIYEKYYLKTISLEDAIYYLYKMIEDIYSSEKLIDVDLSDEIIELINYLSDGLYLAEEGIYGDIGDIRKAFEEFINDYKIIDSNEF